jgi:hypothetical protein
MEYWSTSYMGKFLSGSSQANSFYRDLNPEAFLKRYSNGGRYSLDQGFHGSYK